MNVNAVNMGLTNAGEMATGAAESLRAKMLALAAAKQAAAQRAQVAGSVATAKMGAAAAYSLDAFGSRPTDGTGRLHAVLAEAYACGVTLSARECAEQAAYGNAQNHLTQGLTFKGRVMRVGRGQWRLTDAAGELWHGQGKAFGFAVAEQQTPPAESQQNAETPPPVAELAPEVAAPAPAENAPQTANTATNEPGEVKGKGKKGGK